METVIVLVGLFVFYTILSDKLDDIKQRLRDMDRRLDKIEFKS